MADRRPTQSRPNLILFQADQLRADVLSPFAPGRRTAFAPNLEDLAKRSTVFRDAWVQHPVCGPSRVSLMTGWYPHVHGHRTLTNLLKPWHPNLLRILRDAGYNTCFAGRRGDLFAPSVTEASTDFCGFLVKPETFYMAPTQAEGSPLWNAMYHGRRPEAVLDMDEATIRTAERWLADGPREPWILYVPLIFPHPPFEVEDPWYSLHQPADMPARIPPRPGKPGFHAALRQAKSLHAISDAQWTEIQRTYFGMVSRVDDQLGRILRAAERSGRGNPAVTVFCADHGEFLGDYGLVEKWPSGLDRPLTRVPLLIHDPRRGGGVVNAPVELMDVFATLCELAEAEPAHTHFAKSLVPLMDRPADSGRPFAVTEGGFRVTDVDLFEEPVAGPYYKKAQLQREQPALVGLAAALRTPRWTYVRRTEEAAELYDRILDPEEVHNRIDDPALAVEARKLELLFTDWLMRTADVIPWDRDPRFPRVPDGYRSPHADTPRPTD